MGRVAAQRPGGAYGVKSATNHIHDDVDLLMHLAGRKSQGLKALITQNLVAEIVSKGLLAFLMMRPINLDHEAPIEADEIEDVAPEWGLSPEMKPLRSQLP